VRSPATSAPRAAGTTTATLVIPPPTLTRPK